MTEVFAGVDLGGTNIKAGLVTDSGEVLEHHQMQTLARRGPEAVAARICQVVRECMEKAGVEPSHVRGVGIGSPGTIDLENGVVLFSPNLPGWRGIPLRRMVEQGLRMPCLLDNDANVAALAEQWVGAGQGASSLVLFTLGTGIGGGIILDGRIWHGANGVAGEVGHMSINPDGPRCNCGNYGCFEVYASATGMVKRMRESIIKGAATSLAARPEEFTAEDIHKAALAGDQPARENIEQTGRYLGLGASNIMHVVNPQVVAFSGGVTAAGDMLMTPLLDEVQKRTLEASRMNVKVCFAALPNDAGIIGAARCFMLQ